MEDSQTTVTFTRFTDPIEKQPAQAFLKAATAQAQHLIQIHSPGTRVVNGYWRFVDRGLFEVVICEALPPRAMNGNSNLSAPSLTFNDQRLTFQNLYDAVLGLQLFFDHDQHGKHWGCAFNVDARSDAGEGWMIEQTVGRGSFMKGWRAEAADNDFDHASTDSGESATMSAISPLGTAFETS